MKEGTEYNLKHYGAAFLSGSYGALWREDIPGKVPEILNREISNHLVEIKAYPEDADGHHWCVKYNILVEDQDGSLISAYEKEGRKRKIEYLLPI